MKIEVKNFGKIKKGQVDLDKKVTVFVGYNNSGKTYVSQLLWRLNSFDILYPFEGSDIAIEGKNIFRITEENVLTVVSDFKDYIITEIMPELFNVDINYFLNDNFFIDFKDEFLAKIKNTSFSYFAVNGDKDNEGYHFHKGIDSLKVSIAKKTYKSVDDIFDDEYDFIYPFDENDSRTEICKQAISKLIANILFDWQYANFFLPANRVFYPTYYKYIYSVAKEEKDIIDNRLKRNEHAQSLKELSKRPYTKAVDELIQKFYGLNSNLKINEQYSDLLNDLKEIIGGDIIVKSSEGIAPIEFYLKLDNGKELEMYLSSSSANQLTTLYLYLKYWVRGIYNFLVIDEPEENLHPENQIKLVNILMKFADRGNKVLITTHSPLITDHVNNYANLSYLNEAGTDTAHLITEGGLNMASIKNIKHADYGVYFFNGDSIKEYSVGDYGAYFEDFQAAENKVKGMSNVLKDSIYKNIHPDA